MGNIVLLDDLTINKIAAGEVIERPASVVKEMVENSIDAGSKNITVEIKNGGISFIKITDDGSGISEDDMEIAFERHATSKIRNASDLETVRTMGFRGEALASIAAISNVEMISKKEGEEIGHRIVVEGGKVLEKSEVGCPVGTTITVKNLFFNTPVRYKFLKKDYTESGYIEDAVKRIAIVNKDVSIKLISSGKTVIQTNGSGDLKNIIYSIFGKDIANGIINVDYTYENIKVTGVVGKPEIARNNRQNQLFFVNGRYVKDKTLSASIEKAYRDVLPGGKFAFAVLNLEMDPSMLDVNVHPAKLEVRFQDESSVFKAVYHAINAAFGKNEPVPEVEEKNSFVSEPEVKVEINKPEIKAEEPKLEMKPGMTIEERINAINDMISQITPAKAPEKAVSTPVKRDLAPEDRLKDLYVSGNIAKNFDEKNDFDNTKSIKLGNTKISSDTQEINVAEVNEKIEKTEIENTVKVEIKPETKTEVSGATMKVESPQEKVVVEKVENENIAKTAKVELPKNNEEYVKKQQEKKDEFISRVTDKLLEAKLTVGDDTEIIDTSKVREAIKEIPEITPEFEVMYKKAFGIDLTQNKKEDEVESEVPEVKEETFKVEDDKLESDASYITSVSNESLFEEEEGYQNISYKFIGVAFSKYIIIEIKENLYLLDKYLATERIIFETLKESYYNEDRRDSQLLLLPDVLKLSPKEMNIAKENLEIFNQAGFEYEEFGNNTIKLSSVPGLCEDLNTKELFLELVGVLDTVAVTAREEKENKFLSKIAVKTAQNVKEDLDVQEIEDLMQRLLRLSNPFVLSNGKAIATKITRADLEKKFSRR